MVNKHFKIRIIVFFNIVEISSIRQVSQFTVFTDPNFFYLHIWLEYRPKFHIHL